MALTFAPNPRTDMKPPANTVPASRFRMPPAGVGGCLLVAVILAATAAVDAVEPPKAETKPDWAALEGLLLAGNYSEAAAMADGIVAAAKRKSWAPDFLARTTDGIRALVWRGLAESRLGDLDAAEATFTDAQRTFRDRDYQRLLALAERQATAAEAGQLILLELTWIELLNAKAAVILDRMRYANLARVDDGDVSAEATSRLKDDVEGWLDDLELLKKTASKAGAELATRLDARGSTVTASPRARALVGRFWPALIAGTTALELGKLPFAALPSKAADAPDPPAATPAVPAETNTRLADAMEQFQEAAAALDEAVTRSLPQGTVALKPDARIEAAVMEAELLVHRAFAEREDGDLRRAREDLDRVVELQREIAGLRKRPYQESHPDMFWPLLLMADIELAESRQLLAEGEAAKAREMDTAASKTLARAAAVSVPESHPLRGFLAKLTARLEGQRASVDETIPRSDQADKAARRLRGALDGTALPGLAF
jgi:tetratricopeptide (TPR) repeat protein